MSRTPAAEKELIELSKQIVEEGERIHRGTMSIHDSGNGLVVGLDNTSQRLALSSQTHDLLYRSGRGGLW